MDKLVKLVSEKTGFPEGVSKVAVETVIGFLKERLPSPIASQIDNVLDGEGTADKIGDAAKGLGGMFDKK